MVQGNSAGTASILIAAPAQRERFSEM